jgi:hypothetical protein
LPAETARPPEGLESYKLAGKPHPFPGDDDQKLEVRGDDRRSEIHPCVRSAALLQLAAPVTISTFIIVQAILITYTRIWIGVGAYFVQEVVQAGEAAAEHERPSAFLNCRPQARA